jgi:hypothetical protein
MAGYATKLVSIQSGILAAVAGITAANGYDVAVASSSADIWESPFDRSVNEFPRGYAYMLPDDPGTIERVDRGAFVASFKLAVDIWVHVQADSTQANLPKYAAAVMYAVEAWQATSTIASEMDIEPSAVSYHHTEKRKSVIRVVYSGRVSFRTTDR